MLGPLIGGVLIETVGFSGAYGSSGSACSNLGLMTRLRIPPSQGTRPGSPSGAAWLRQCVMSCSPMLVGLLYVTMVMNALAFPARQFIPAIGSEIWSRSGVGRLAGGGGELWAARRGRDYSLYATPPVPRTGLSGGLGDRPAHDHAVRLGTLVCAGFCLAGSWGCGQGSGTMQSTITMLATPPAMRGRMMGLPAVTAVHTAPATPRFVTCCGVRPIHRLSGGCSGGCSAGWAVGLSAGLVMHIHLPTSWD